MKQVIYTENAPKPIGPYSQAVKVGNLIFISGQIAIEPSTGLLVNETLEVETRKVMENIHAVLQHLNLHFNNIIKTSIFLKNMDDFAAVNEIYGSYFDADYPARETVEVSRLPKNVNVEISVIAGS